MWMSGNPSEKNKYLSTVFPFFHNNTSYQLLKSPVLVTCLMTDILIRAKNSLNY